MKILSATELKALRQARTPKACNCSVGHCASWESVPNERWPAAQMQHCATLRDEAVYEPTFEEYHPSGTRYDSADAPIAVQFFPANRADVYQCNTCQHTLLRYTEFGGYYIDHRVREVKAELVVTEPVN